MAVILEQTMPEGVDVALLDEITAEMGVKESPPPGLIVHVHFADQGRVRVVDVWESAEQFDAFQNQRLMPAFQKVIQRKGAALGNGMTEPSLTEVANVVKGG